MYRVLNLGLEQAGLDNVHVIPPADNIYGSQLADRLQEEREQQNNQDRTILVPYNIGLYHWVGIAIGVNAANDQLTVNYMDPLRSNAALPANIRAEIERIYPEAVINVNQVNYHIQNDNTSCGPITIRNLMDAARNTPPRQPTYFWMIQVRRIFVKRNVDLVNDQDGDNGAFETRQRLNQHTFSTAFNLHQYLSPKKARPLSQPTNIIISYRRST